MRVGMQARVESCPTELTSLLRAWEEEHASADVYLTARPFQSWGGAAFQSLPLPVKEAIVDMGVCHYMVITRDANGVIRQWDFGPRGGDVHVDLPGSSLRPRPICSGRAATSMETVPLDDAPDEGGASSSFSSGGLRPGVPGEVRESVLLALPTHAPLMHVGKTSLSPQQIREFSVRQPTHYLLHKNDCRHYTNNLVCHMTGRERSTAHFLRKQYHNKVARDGALYHLHRPIVEAAQLVTDVSNWEAIRAATITGATVVMSVLGACLPFLGARLPLLLPPLRSMSGLVQLLPPLQSVPGILQLRLPASAARGALQTHAAAVSTALRERASGLLVAAPYVRGVEQHAARLKASAVARPALAAVSAFVSLSSSGVGFHNGGAIMMAQGSRGWPPPEAAMSMISWGGGADARGTRGCGALVAAAAPGGAWGHALQAWRQVRDASSALVLRPAAAPQQQRPAPPPPPHHPSSEYAAHSSWGTAKGGGTRSGVCSSCSSARFATAGGSSWGRAMLGRGSGGTLGGRTLGGSLSLSGGGTVGAVTAAFSLAAQPQVGSRCYL